MKILIDAFLLLSPLTGIGRYTYEVARYIQQLGEHELSFNYGSLSSELYGLKNAPSQEEQKRKKLQNFLKQSSFLKKYGRYFYMYKAKFYRDVYDLYFQPAFLPNPFIKAKKVICTIHDFSFLLHPQWHPQERVKYFKTNIHLAKKADHVITGSNFTKQEIITYLHIPQESITVIYHGVNHHLFRKYQEKELQKTKQKFALKKDFLLFVGSIEPRKNLSNLLKAYSLLTHSQKEALPLVLVGFKGWENKEIMQELQKHKNFVSYLGFVSDEELAHLYNLATVFIYPSLYEGFGLPPLEAMACGAAVIVSDVASLPEVCADGALYVDPNNMEQISQAILLLAEDATKREALQAKAIVRASSFSWEKSATAHLELFKKVQAS